MELAYWGLRQSPFRNGPMVPWFYESPTHEEALARLSFLVEEQYRLGIIAGPAGTGKSRVLKLLQRQLRRPQREIVAVDLFGLGGELLRQVAVRLHLSSGPAASEWDVWRAVRDELAGRALAGVQTVFIFDHYDRNDPGCQTVLERLLSIGARHQPRCTFLVAARQPDEPSACENRDDMRSPSRLDSTRNGRPPDRLARAADLESRLTPWNRQETAFYVRHSLQRCGASEPVFQQDALEAVYELSGGTPRAVNRLCDMALLAAVSEGRQTIDADIIEAVADELPGLPDRRPAWNPDTRPTRTAAAPAEHGRPAAVAEPV